MMLLLFLGLGLAALAGVGGAGRVAAVMTVGLSFVLLGAMAWAVRAQVAELARFTV